MSDKVVGSDTSDFRITGELSYLDRNNSSEYFNQIFDDENDKKKKIVQNAKLITAIKTPYTATGRIDVDAFDKHVQH